jgi:hypothetical protein
MAASSSSSDIHLSESQPINAPRATIWAGLVDKIRHPEKFVGATDVVIVEEGPDFVRREMSALGQRMKERITWDEEKGLVTFTFDNDPFKTGCVTNLIEEKEGQTFLTFTFEVHWTDAAPQAMKEGMEANLKKSAASAVSKSIAVIEAMK